MPLGKLKPLQVEERWAKEEENITDEGFHSRLDKKKTFRKKI